MGLFSSTKNPSASNDIWESISDPQQVESIVQKSEQRPQLIYKHSHRCSICTISKGTLESAANDILEDADMHFINVVNSREASNFIASELDVRHESPQVILLEDGEVVWHASHGSINADAILEKVA
jgi:bacillithiol system protein YtxJ